MWVLVTLASLKSRLSLRLLQMTEAVLRVLQMSQGASSPTGVLREPLLLVLVRLRGLRMLKLVAMFNTPALREMRRRGLRLRNPSRREGLLGLVVLGFRQLARRALGFIDSSRALPSLETLERLGMFRAPRA
jgi:hypothetical protein